VFPANVPHPSIQSEGADFLRRGMRRTVPRIARPRVCITVFPGTNCEYDSARAFDSAGAETHIFVMKNLSAADIDESIHRIIKLIKNSQILMIPGGFSAGDEPDGSGKFIAAFIRNPRVRDAVEELLGKRDGLMLGICNGFQALIKLGLVPLGRIIPMEPASPTLTFNTIGRHISRMAYTRVTSVKSPWFAKVNIGDIHTVPISHGEGRFVAPEPLIAELFKNGQVATRYVGPDGNLLDDYTGNPNGSDGAIEGITSKDGRVLGKMGHSERRGEQVAKNIHGSKDQLIFESGVSYFL
jgi:phosphoribosylformylglycinamidine synthase